MAKIIYTPIGKPSKKTSRGLKKATAYFYVGNAKVPGNHALKYASFGINLIAAAIVGWLVLHK